MRATIVALLLPATLIFPAFAAAQAAPQGSQEQRIQLLERRIGALSDILLRLDRIQGEIKQLRGEIELQAHAMEALKKRQRDLYLDIDQRLAGGAGADMPSDAEEMPQAAAGGAPVAPPAEESPTPLAGAAPGTAPPPPVPVPSGDPAREAASYQAAFDLLMQRRYDEARTEFEQFLASYPGGQYADNAQYWLAEASYVTRDFARAEVEFARVVEAHPASAKVPDALLKIGYIQYEQRQWQAARGTLTRLVNDYPASTAARLAEKRLEKMAAEGR